MLEQPRHPYTQALVSAVPTADHAPGTLTTIGGRVPDLAQAPPGCRFSERCPVALPLCGEVPRMLPVGDEHEVACWHVEQAVAR